MKRVTADRPDISLPPWARRVPGGLEIRVKVVPNASRSEIVGTLGDRLKIRVAASPEGGKANRAVEELLRGYLGAARVEVAGGRSRPEKVVLVAAAGDVEELARRLLA